MCVLVIFNSLIRAINNRVLQNLVIAFPEPRNDHDEENKWPVITLPRSPLFSS